MLVVDVVPVFAAATEWITSFQLPDKLPELDYNALATFAIVLGLVVAVWKSVGERLKTATIDVFFTNWRLGLLGATGLVLSLASGWTTWDGMRNFTREPLLSLMITFGIQGVMLIVAWLIGESFATGMNYRPHAFGRSGRRPPQALAALRPFAGAVAGILVFLALSAVVMSWLGGREANQALLGGLGVGMTDELLIGAVGVLLVGVILVNAGSDILDDYMQAIRVMVRSAVLWVMFLACMATSVFFSFDSLFSTIFPQSERARAAELRAQNQVAGIVNDVGALTVKRRIEEADRLFETDGWKAFDVQLDKITQLSNRAPALIREQIAQELEQRRQRIAVLEEKRATAEGGQAGLATRKTQLTEELSRVQGARPETAAAVAEHKSIVAGIERRLDEQRALALAEEKGVEGSGKVGRGQMWRAAKAEEAKVEAELQVAEARLKSHEQRLIESDRRAATIKAELAQIDGDLAKLKGEASTAGQLIGVAEGNDRAANANTFDPAAGVAALDKIRQQFRQDPKRDTLMALESQCLALQNASFKVPTLKTDAVTIDCDPGTASEAAARVFALNVGVQSLAQNCIGGSKLPETGGADALFSFARKCVQDAGLPSVDTDALRTQINSVELNRDDKAHRFVVTWNAFQDGNRLAYLALAIAIAINALVFMSGLFGANAVRSPLSDVPSHRGRSATQLEAIIENALLPDKFESATMALELIHPSSRDARDRDHDGWTHEVIVPYTHMAAKTRLIKVLNAGATISAVRRDPEDPARYLVRSEFVEFLNIIAKRAFEHDKDNVKLAELKKILVVALQPDIASAADVVLSHLHPISEREGYSSEVYMKAIANETETRIVRRALNSGATLGYVERDGRKGEEDRFYIRNEFYRTLSIIAAEFSVAGHHQALPTPSGDRHVVDGGDLAPATPRIATHVGHERELTDQRPRQAASSPPPHPQQTPPARPQSQPIHVASVNAPRQSVPTPAPIAPASQPQTALQRPATTVAIPAADSLDHDTVRRAFLAHLLEAVNADPQRYFAMAGETVGAASGIGEALDTLRRSHAELDGVIREREAEMRARLDRTFQLLAARIGLSDTWRQRLLSDAHSETEQMLDVIAMLPGGPFDTLIEQIVGTLGPQEASGELDDTPSDKELLRDAKRLRSHLLNNPRQTPKDWETLAEVLSWTPREQVVVLQNRNDRRAGGEG